MLELGHTEQMFEKILVRIQVCFVEEETFSNRFLFFVCMFLVLDFSFFPFLFFAPSLFLSFLSFPFLIIDLT